jgi:hypothetical protein
MLTAWRRAFCAFIESLPAPGQVEWTALLMRWRLTRLSFRRDYRCDTSSWSHRIKPSHLPEPRCRNDRVITPRYGDHGQTIRNTPTGANMSTMSRDSPQAMGRCHCAMSSPIVKSDGIVKCDCEWLAAIRKCPLSRTFWSGRRDSNPRPSPWQREENTPLSPSQSPDVVSCPPIRPSSPSSPPIPYTGLPSHA